MTGSAADVIARRLHAAGVRHAFGIPGGEVLTLIDALDRAGIRFVLVKHENAGGFMAEGTHHATGAPAVLVATVGPGVANAVNVVANAQQDRVPMIFLTGCIDPADQVTYTHQVFDHGAVLRPVVKASFRLEAGAVADQIDKAVAIATDDPPGPVHLDLPIRLAGAEEAGDGRPRRAVPIPGVPAEGPALDRARALLAGAERPLMIAGLEAIPHAQTIAAFARAQGVPLLTTYKAKGLLPEADPLALGGAGLSPAADVVLKPLVAAADLILLAGYDPIEMRIGWRDPWDPAATPVVEFAATPNTHYVHHATLSFVGDVGAGIAALGRGTAPRPRWTDGRIDAARAALAGSFGRGEAWGPAAIVEAVRAAMPDDTVATCDTGAHRILLSQVWECRRPHSLLQSTGLCTMGTAVPLAVGVKLADPARPVVAFTGDGGLEMVMGELATVRDLGVALPIVVFVDASLALIEMKQRSSNLANLGVDMGRTDFAALARAMGGIGVDVGDRAALGAAVREAAAADRFTVIAAHIPRGSYDGRI